MVRITQMLIEDLVREVAPKVAEFTGWEPKIEGLTVKIVKHKDHWEQAVKPILQSLELTSHEMQKQEELYFKEKQHLEAYGKSMTYQTITETLLVYADNMGWRTNREGLACAVGHELTHRFQFENNAGFKQDFLTFGNCLEREELSTSYKGINVQRLRWAYLTLLEGDAQQVRAEMERQFYPQARYTKSFIATLGEITHLVNQHDKQREETLREETTFYEEAEDIIATLQATRGRKAVNDLYSYSQQELVDFFA